MLQLQFLSLACLVLLSAGCHQAVENLKDFPEVKTLDNFPATQFVPTLEEKVQKGKNVIYAVSFLLAWDELRNQIGTPIVTSVPQLKLVNQSGSYKGVLEGNEYKKDVKVDGGNINILTFFSKSLSYAFPMDTVTSGFTFKGKAVRAFGMIYYDEDIASEIKILYYKNDDEFILKIQTKEKDQDLILAKGFEKGERLDVLLDKIQHAIETGQKEMLESTQQLKYSLLDEDDLIIPVLRFNLSTHYSDMESTVIRVKDLSYRIDKASQRTAFLLDEHGAKVESEAELSVEATDSGAVVIPKQLFFNKPFVVLLKKQTAKYPYFMMKVDNTELMIPLTK
jgi:hypothetical protein